MPKAGLDASERDEVLAALGRADAELAMVGDRLRQAYGRAWLAKARTLRRQAKGLQEGVRRQYLEQEAG